MELTEQGLMEAFGVSAETGADAGGSQNNAGTAETSTDPAQGQEQGNAGAPAETPEPAQAGQQQGELPQRGERGRPGPQPTQGGNEPEPAEPVDEGGTDPTGEPGTPPERRTEKPAQSPEENRRFAAARRKAEQEAAIEQARQAAREEAKRAADEEMKQFFVQAGLRNPYSNTAITNMEEYRQYQEQHRTEQLRKAMAEGKMTPEQLNEAITQNPAIRQILDERARQAQAAPAEGQAAQPSQEQPERQPSQSQPPAQGADIQARMAAEVAEIGRMDPAIRETADLLKQPWSKEFYGYVKEGYSFLGAYHKAVSAQQTQQAAAAAKQQAINNVASKQHLKSGAPQGGGMEAVPAAEMRYFRTFMPDASEAEIQKFYNKYKQNR